MLRTRLKLKAIKFKKKEYRIALDDYLFTLMLRTAAVWVRKATGREAVQGIYPFPVKTGMAKASFEPLVDYLRYPPQGKKQSISFSVDPDLTDPQVYADILAGKSRKAGRAQSKKSNFIVKYKNQYGVFMYRFEWNTTVAHFLANETTMADSKLNLKTPTPWRVIQDANAAAEAFLNAQRGKMPKVTDFIVAEPETLPESY